MPAYLPERGALCAQPLRKPFFAIYGFSALEEYQPQHWFYTFREISEKFDVSPQSKKINQLYTRYAKLSKSWDITRNTEWLCRHYLAAKLIMAATLKINSIEYAELKNLRLVVSYLQYYALLSLIRALVLTLPEQPWNSGGLVEIGHNKAIQLAADHIKLFDRKLGEEIKDFALQLKASRELISYRAPSSGDSNLPEAISFEDICITLAELAQLNSEILEKSIEKHAPQSSFRLDESILRPLVDVEIGESFFYDREDAYRLGYFARKCPRPNNILFTMREGHVEDFFGAWCEDEPTEGNFDPDEGWGVIFDIP